jgi:nicotinate-nucleotide pyrophosphorylase (carboxylating)
VRLEAIALPLVRLALTEDLGGGDVTTEAIVDPETPALAHIEARAEGVLAGGPVAALAFRELDPQARITWQVQDGGAFVKGTRLCEIRAKARAVLSAERVALNFLQRLSGVATQARAFVRAVDGTGVTILDTRKTTPGHRLMEKFAVLAGGAMNHRYGLFDTVLIKENHIRVAGSLTEAVARARTAASGLPIVVEARNEEEAEEAAALDVDRILLDNFNPPGLARVLKRLGSARRGKKAPVIEVSGGIKLSNVREFALPGVSFLSVGALTHSAPAIDLSLMLDAVGAEVVKGD